MDAPTAEQLNDEDGFESVDRKSSPWRHGEYVSQVFRREADNTFWCARYRLSTDGETNELRDGGAVITQVRPEQRTVTVYVNL